MSGTGTLTSEGASYAKRLLESGRANAAASAATEWLRDHPRDPAGYHVLGRAFCALGQPALAVTVLSRAVELQPQESQYSASLAVALAMSDDRSGALRELARGCVLDPTSTVLRLEYGLLYLTMGNGQDALAHFRRVLVESPGNSRALVGSALALALEGHMHEARESFRSACEIKPQVHLEMVRLRGDLLGRGQADEALELSRLGLAIGATDPQLTYEVEAAEGGAFDRAPLSYVETMFDRFSESFDSVLRDRLSYRTPELIAAAALRHLAERPESPRILDGGCGTGLCAPLLRPVAGHLVGVDASAGMLDRARERDMYDELVQSELVAFLATRPATFDLIVCADVLVYFGDLSEFFLTAASALKADGVLAISIERMAGDGFSLQGSGRFAHAETYVRVTAEHARLAELSAEPCELRLERGAWVPGLLAVYRSPGE